MRSLSWHSFLKILALIFLAIALVAWSVTIVGWLTTDNPKFEPLNVLVSAVIPSVLSLLTYLSSRNASTEPITLSISDNRLLEKRNRQRMLAKVRDFWVKGVLEDSLQNAVWIELGKEEKREAVEQPLDMVLQRPERPNRTLPKGTKIIQVFDDLSGNMLILGEPGSGKTTTLLELARDLIDRAEKDDTLPMPVVFNLSSWAAERKPLADWLADELNTKYQVPKKVAQEWVKTDALTLLLDGLDEVAQQHRNTCVEAINAYKDVCTSIVDIVVCSRTNEYDDLTTKLKLQGAIVLKPLTTEQIAAHLEAFGEKTLILRRLLQDTERKSQLMEIAKSPLMLNVMIVAYQPENMPTDVAILGSSFILGKAHPYNANKLLFDTYVKQMFKRRGCDPRYTQAQTMRWLGWMARKMTGNPTSIFYIEGMQPTWLEQRSQRSFQGWLVGQVTGIVLGLGLGLSFALPGALTGKYGFGTPIGIGLTAGLVTGMIWGITWAKLGWPGKIELAEGVKWSLPWFTVALALMLSLIMVALFGAKWIISILFFLLLGFELREDTEIRIYPNQGIWSTARTSLGFSFILGLVLFIIGWLNTNLETGLAGGLAGWLLLGLTVFKGFSLVEHLVFRLILTHSGYAPWNYARFLDFCAERIFLRKVGGGYIFVHRLLMEYFAGLGEDNGKPQAQ